MSVESKCKCREAQLKDQVSFVSTNIFHIPEIQRKMSQGFDLNHMTHFQIGNCKLCWRKIASQILILDYILFCHIKQISLF